MRPPRANVSPALLTNRPYWETRSINKPKIAKTIVYHYTCDVHIFYFLRYNIAVKSIWRCRPLPPRFLRSAFNSFLARRAWLIEVILKQVEQSTMEYTCAFPHTCHFCAREFQRPYPPMDLTKVGLNRGARRYLGDGNVMIFTKSLNNAVRNAFRVSAWFYVHIQLQTIQSFWQGQAQRVHFTSRTDC